ncbi:PREDICTED: ribonuclease H2 subunit B [Fragaria vesca subsp. vesca]|uniref:ribonuclease H2 subunit B n=1 Tax=Fragaria vesca subsp. vesca TaxID=101020 RepID=UPI0002C33C7D|nr:PREDICTED: ribonuclease H2 subunit B [Fragaria vesca subsp. vesca]
MAWCQGFDETRLLIAADPPATGDGAGKMISLRHPKSGNTMCCLLVDGMLQELNWFRQSYSSWFLGDYVSEDGGLYTATRLDPVFVLLPIFEEARMKKRDDPGKFRPLDEIIFVDGYPAYQHLLSIAEVSMQVVCDIKEIDSTKYFRLDDSKVLAWLYHKACQLKETLSTLDSNYAAREDKQRLTDAVSILGEYLKDEPWLKLLCDRLRIDLPEAPKKAPDTETLPTAYESSPGIWNGSQEKSKSDNKVTTRAAGRQAKKIKPETESHNIRDMFTRASSRKK